MEDGNDNYFPCQRGLLFFHPQNYNGVTKAITVRDYIIRYHFWSTLFGLFAIIADERT